MIKYAKIINQETGLCEVGIGTNTDFYKSIGMIELDVQQSDIDGSWYLSEKCQMKTDEEKQEQERERLNNLSMTRGDVFEALILAKGLGKAQIRSMIEKAELDTVTKALYLNRFDEALEFYRGYPIFDMLGEALDITPRMLNRFFNEKDYHYLTKCKLTINPIPAEAKVTYDQNPAPYREVIHYKVELEGYKTVEGDFPIDRNFTVDIELEKIEEVVDENTTDTEQPTDVSNEVEE